MVYRYVVRFLPFFSAKLVVVVVVVVGIVAAAVVVVVVFRSFFVLSFWSCCLVFTFFIFSWHSIFNSGAPRRAGVNFRKWWR